MSLKHQITNTNSHASTADALLHSCRASVSFDFGIYVLAEMLSMLVAGLVVDKADWSPRQLYAFEVRVCVCVCVFPCPCRACTTAASV